MLVQQLLTEPIFQALFDKEDILANNPIYKQVEKLIGYLSFTKKELREGELKEFYKNIQDRAKGHKTFEDKQAFLNELYEKFFKKFDEKEADQRGLVYTPQEIVRFMVRITDDILKKHFNTQLESPDINIIDLFTGTGNFIINILRHFKNKEVAPELIQKNFLNNLHFNEIMLFPYYIACINIEYYYQNITGYNDNFTGAVLVDTFTTLDESKQQELIKLNENTQRIEDQKKLPFKVIITNPPYRAGQKSGNDDNQNQAYKVLDDRIKETYSKYTETSNKKNLQDYYIKAFRLASDKIQDKGVIAFITPNQLLNSNSFSGFRICLEREFYHIYHFDLKGNMRNISKEDIKKQGGSGVKGNVFGIATGVGITILVKDKTKPQGNLNLYRIDDYTTKEQKLKILDDFKSLEQVPLETIKPIESIWVNPPKKEFKSSFISLGDKQLKNSKSEPQGVIFYKYSLGINTKRDFWVYDYSRETLKNKISNMIDFYNQQLEEKENNSNFKESNDKTKIKWSPNLKRDFSKNLGLSYKQEQIREINYRPFSTQFVYYNKSLNEALALLPKIFPKKESENLGFSITGKGSGDFTSLVFNNILDIYTIDKGQFFPYYFYHQSQNTNQDDLYSKEEETITNDFGEQLTKKENITQWALNHFRDSYNAPEYQQVGYFLLLLWHTSQPRI